MDFRKIFFFWVVIFFANRISAQTDSTDINFGSESYVPQTQQDSLAYGANNLSQLTLEFDIDDLPNFGKVSVEVIAFYGEATEETVYDYAYTLSDLIEMQFIDDNHVLIDITVLELVHEYKVVVRLEDILGHQKVNITKNLEQ